MCMLGCRPAECMRGGVGGWVATLLPIQGSYEREGEGAGSWLSIISPDPVQTRAVL